MKQEYDFSHAVRGKFFRKRAALNVAICVDGPMHKRLAWKKGKPVTDLVSLGLPVACHKLNPV